MKETKNWLKLFSKTRNDEIGTKGKNLKIISQKTNYLVPKTLVLTIDLFKSLVKYNKIQAPLFYLNGIILKFHQNTKRK